MPPLKNNIAIVGAGLTGSLLAIYLAKRGFRVHIYERRPDMRKTAIVAGRSINLAISARGINALEKLGLADKMLTKAVPMRGRMIHSESGDLNFQPYGKNEHEYINSISRRDLNCMLMDEAEKYPEVHIQFNARCTGMDFEKKELYLFDETEKKEFFVMPDTVIGTDGSASSLRMEFLKTGFFNFSQEYENYGYKELSIPADMDGSFKLEKNALHIWPRGSYMMIALPNHEGDFTCTLFMSYKEGKENFEALKSKEKVQDFFQRVMPDAIPLMPNYADDFFKNPTGNLLTVKCFPWHIGGKALLMGDASHAIVPFFGQGMNCAFEDCFYFDSLVEKHHADWEKVFEEFGKLRKENTDAIADLAQENFVEMRDLVAHPDFLLKKKAEVLLENKYPDIFISKYAMVSFHHIPYAIAKKRGQIQDKILMELCSKIKHIEELNPEAVFQEIMGAFKKAGIPEKYSE